MKPANILVKSGKSDSAYESYFKLADLGLSHFQRVLEGQGDTRAADSHGTRSYGSLHVPMSRIGLLTTVIGAPECYRLDDFLERSTLKVKKNVDIWSLGCVFSEAAVWVACGYTGVISYRQQRRSETSSFTAFKDADCFHNGVTVLSTVTKWHEYCLSVLRQSDYITASVLGLVKEMLEKTEYRLDAEQLWGRATQRIQDAKFQEGREKERIANGGHPTVSPSRDTTLYGPPESPPNPYPPPPPQFTNTDQTPPRSSQRNSRGGSDSKQPPPNFGAPREHSPDSISTAGEGSPVEVHRSHSSGRRTNRPPHSTHGHKPRGQVSYSISEGQLDEFQDLRISEEDQQYDDMPKKDPWKGNVSRQKSRGKSTHFDDPQSQQLQQIRHGVSDFPEGAGGSSKTRYVEQQAHHSGSRHSARPISMPHREESTDSLTTSNSSQGQTLPTKNSVAPGLSPPAVNRQPQNIQPPFCSVGEAVQWKADMKKSGVRPKPLPHEYLKDRLKLRDHVSCKQYSFTVLLTN